MEIENKSSSQAQSNFPEQKTSQVSLPRTVASRLPARALVQHSFKKLGIALSWTLCYDNNMNKLTKKAEMTLGRGPTGPTVWIRGAGFVSQQERKLELYGGNDSKISKKLQRSL